MAEQADYSGVIEVPVSEATERLPGLVDKVLADDLFVYLTRDGNRVAVLMPADIGENYERIEDAYWARRAREARSSHEAKPILTREDGSTVARLFADFAQREGMLAGMTAEQCADIAKVFVHGYACGSGETAGQRGGDEARQKAERDGLRAQLADAERQTRARIAASLRRAAAGRREYAAMTSSIEGREALLRAAECHEECAGIIENPANLLDVVPSWQWPDFSTS